MISAGPPKLFEATSALLPTGLKLQSQYCLLDRGYQVFGTRLQIRHSQGMSQHSRFGQKEQKGTREIRTFRVKVSRSLSHPSLA